MIYFDFTKAFDKVDHGVLLHKLKRVGITGKMAPQLSLRQETFCTSPKWCKQRWPGTQWCAARHCDRTSAISSPTIRHFH